VLDGPEPSYRGRPVGAASNDVAEIRFRGPQAAHGIVRQTVREVFGAPDSVALYVGLRLWYFESSLVGRWTRKGAEELAREARRAIGTTKVTVSVDR